MNPKLQQRIAAIKAQCEEILILSEKATPGPWNAEITSANDFVVAGKKYVCSLATLSGREHDFRFIAHSRNVSPAMARVVVHTIEQLERLTNDDEEQWSFDALESIANQWEGK